MATNDGAVPIRCFPLRCQVCKRVIQPPTLKAAPRAMRKHREEFHPHHVGEISYKAIRR